VVEEMTDWQNRPLDPQTGNVHNGTRPKTVLTEASGRVQLEVPRDQGMIIHLAFYAG
jgi:putative transposase